MGDCKYCGKPAGFLKSAHKDCERQYKEKLAFASVGEGKMVDAIKGSISLGGDAAQLEQTLASIEAQYNVLPTRRRDLLINGWEKSVDIALEDGILEHFEEQNLMAFAQHFMLGQADLNRTGSYVKVAQSAVLRDVLEGKIPNRVQLDGSLGINFQKGEQLVWLFKDVGYLEDKVRREFVGRSQGVSIRVMKGVYYRVGQFKGHPVETKERVHVDTGKLIVTDKNLYFAGGAKSFRVPYSKIVSFEPYSNGMGIMKDNATAKPQIFVTGDGWFVYNLVTNLSQC